MELALLFIWIIGACLNLLIAEEKGRDHWKAFFSSLMISPVIVYLYLLAVPALNPNLEDEVPGDQ